MPWQHLTFYGGVAEDQGVALSSRDESCASLLGAR